MDRALLIAAGPGEWRAALLEDGVAVELYVERGDRSEIGSIHLGRVRRLLPALGAALVDIGGDRPAFLAQSDLVPRGKRLHEGERVVVQIRRESQGGKAARLAMAVTPGATISSQRWQEILDHAAALEPPARLHPAASRAAALTGVLPGKPSHITVDDPGAIPEIRTVFSGTPVAHTPETDWPLGLDSLFAEALSETVALPAAGSAHFETTRGGVMIDIDSGTPETGSPERTGLETNRAAAAIIARQIRLRNLGGGIIIDFIGMDGRAGRDKIRAALAEALVADPAKPQILGWTRLGHLELVRPRRGRPLAEALLEPRRDGALVKTPLTIAYEALRALRREARARPGHQWRLIAAPDVAAVLMGTAADLVRTAEERFARKIAIEADPGYHREQFQISVL